MEIKKQISIFLANKPGTFAKVADSLAEAGVNIIAFTVADAVDHAVVRMVVNNPIKAIHILGEAGMLVLETEVVALSLANKPGALAKVAEQFGKKKLNIDYAYGSARGTRGKGILYVKPSNMKRAVTVLEKMDDKSLV